MKELFGIPTPTIALVMLGLLALAIAVTAFIAITNRTWFRMGLRNLPRRGVQSVLVIVGLMLATLITTAAFVTGDTIDHSLTKGTYDLFQRSDLDVTWNGERDFMRDAGAATAAEPAYLDERAVGALERQFAGDPEIAAFLPALYQQAPVRDLRSGKAAPVLTLAGYDPVRLAAAGGLRPTGGGQAALGLQPGFAYLNQRAADELDARAGDTVSVTIGGKAHGLKIVGIVESELASGELGLEYTNVPGGLAMPLAELRAIAGLEPGAISNLTVALSSTSRESDAAVTSAVDRIEAFIAGPGGALFGPENGLEPGRTVAVVDARREAIEESELSGNLFTTLFLILGLFGMAAGIMLIFMIFVMLAAERRAEMGMARAIGAQRSHLVQSFIAEGMAYSLLAGLVGAALGVGASYGMTSILLKQVGGDYFSLVEFDMSLTSVVIGYSLGVVITFITVVFASLKAAHVNIVTAIRGLADEPVKHGRRATRWGWVFAGIPALIVPPLGLWFLLRKGFGLQWVWILAPAGIVSGLFLMMAGRSSESLFLFGLGISLLPLCAAALVRRFGAPARATWTAVGLLLLAYWLLPTEQHDALFGKFDSDIEMFVLSGIMISVAATLVIVFNSGALLKLFRSAGEGASSYAPAVLLAIATAASVAAGAFLGDRGDGLGELAYLVAGVAAVTTLLAFASARFAQLGPALKMAVAYPLSSRFRTGMTIAMFSIIVFSLTVFSILIDNFSTLQGGEDARGGFDIVATSRQDDAVADIPAVLSQAGSSSSGRVAAAGRTSVYPGSQQVRQPGKGDFELYAVLAADDAFFATLQPTLEHRAEGYADDAAVLAAVRSNGAFAIVDNNVLEAGNNDSFDWAADGVTVTDHRFAPFLLELRNADTGQVTTVTIIGSLKSHLPASTIAGVYLNEDAYRATFGAPSYQRHYLRLTAGTDARAVAADIEVVLAGRGVQADSVKKLLDDMNGRDLAFNRMFQAFMALGLLVGIAGLGVVAFRSVVERRQQIGMLRAIGYQRGTIALTFLLESSFVATMGILAGVAGGAVLARNLLTSDTFTESSITFALPWPEIIMVVLASYGFALLMTWWPSRGAARVPVAEALRYE